MRLHEQVSDLKRENKSLKMKLTKLEKKNGADVATVAKSADKQLKDLKMQLEASEQRADELDSKLAQRDLEVNDLRDEIHSFQQLIRHTAAVTTWKTY